MDELIGIGRCGGPVFYSAVDSIHCGAGAFNALVFAGKVGGALGQLRHKGTFRTGAYYGVGDYVLDGKQTRSGLPDGAMSVSCERYSYHDTECAAEVIDHGPRDELIDREITLTLPHSYRFGKVGKDGWVTPFDAREII